MRVGKRMDGRRPVACGGVLVEEAVNVGLPMCCVGCKHSKMMMVVRTNNALWVCNHPLSEQNRYAVPMYGPPPVWCPLRVPDSVEAIDVQLPVIPDDRERKNRKKYP